GPIWPPGSALILTVACAVDTASAAATAPARTAIFMLTLSVLPAPARQRWRRPHPTLENQMWEKCEKPCPIERNLPLMLLTTDGRSGRGAPRRRRDRRCPFHPHSAGAGGGTRLPSERKPGGRARPRRSAPSRARTPARPATNSPGARPRPVPTTPPTLNAHPTPP